MVWPGGHGRIYYMAWLAWHGIGYGQSLYMVWPGGHGMVYGMAWRTWHGKWYGMAANGMAYGMTWWAMAWYMVCPGKLEVLFTRIGPFTCTVPVRVR